MGNCGGICTSNLTKMKGDIVITSNYEETGKYLEEKEVTKIIFLQKEIKKFLIKIKSRKKAKNKDNNNKKNKHSIKESKRSRSPKKSKKAINILHMMRMGLQKNY